MKQKEIIVRLEKQIRRYAYEARVQEELKNLNFDTDMMDFHNNVNCGKAFGMMEIYRDIANKAADNIYEEAQDEAIADIREANYNIIKLLDLAGFSGQDYYDTHMKYQA